MIALFDIDGVLTDGRVYIVDGQESKNMSYEDIDAIFALKRAGIKIGFITGEPQSKFTEYVRNKFNPDYFIVNCKDKYSCSNLNSAVYVGDSSKDIELLKTVKYSFCPADAPQEVKQVCKYITKATRGQGVIKEVAEFILTDDISRALECRIDIIKTMNTPRFTGHLKKTADIIKTALKNGNKVLVCGNGGSAADAQHFAAELVGRFLKEREPYNVEALTTNTSILTAVANDYSFDEIFSRQIEAKGKQGDVLIAISTSGQSENVIKAITKAQELNMHTIALTGLNLLQSDYCINIPSVVTPAIQEAHILVLHILAELIEGGMEK